MARPYEELPHVTLPEDYPTNTGPFLASMYEKHGPIFGGTTWFGDEVVYMVGPEANRFVLSSDRLKFSHHQGWGQAFGVVNMLGNGLLTMDGAEHDQHRRMMNPAFAVSYMDKYLPIMNRLITERTAKWLAKGEVDIYDEARKITFDVAAEALAGLQPGKEVDRFREIFMQMLMLGMNTTTEDEYNTAMDRLKR